MSTSAFSMAEAIAVCTSKIKARKAERRPTYVMYYGNDLNRYEGKITGATCAELTKLFHDNHAQHKFAVITPISDPSKYVRFFNRDAGKKFTNPNVVRKAKK